MDATVRIARADELADCIEVRREVFVVGQDVPETLEVDGLDPECIHFIATVEDKAVGTARLRFVDGSAKAERVAVLETARGLHLGHRLMDALEAEARRRGHQEVVLSAQVPVISFYERRGYRAEGPVYKDAGIDHRTMRRTWPNE